MLENHLICTSLAAQRLGLDLYQLQTLMNLLHVDERFTAQAAHQVLVPTLNRGVIRFISFSFQVEKCETGLASMAIMTTVATLRAT